METKLSLRNRFNKIRESGKYNMFMEAKTVSKMLNLSIEEYFEFIDKIEEIEEDK